MCRPEWNKRYGEVDPIRVAITDEHVSARSLARVVGKQAACLPRWTAGLGSAEPLHACIPALHRCWLHRDVC
jgi:hypothetical protein